MFRKPKRSIRAQRKIVNSDDEDEATKEVLSENKLKSNDNSQNGSSTKETRLSDDDAQSLKEIQSNISKFKEGKGDKKNRNKHNKSVDKGAGPTKTSSTGNFLSFEQELEGG